MKIKSASADPDAVPHGLKDVQVRDTRWGIVVQKRPGKRKKPPTELQKLYQERFAFAGRMASNPHWLDHHTAIEMAKGTEQVPRDILTMAALGRYYVITNPDGTEWGHVEGPAVPLPEEPEPTEPPPVQRTLEDEMQWTHWDAAYTNPNSTTNFCFKGLVMTPREPRVLQGVSAVLNTNAGGQYAAVVGTLNAANVITDITTSAPAAAPGTGQNVLAFPLDYELLPGTPHFVMIGRTDQTATFALNMWISANPRWLWPVTNNGAARMAQLNPAIGQTVELPGTLTVPPIGLRF